jgi:hypothetical protein
METSRRTQILSMGVALIFLSAAMIAGYLKIGLPPVFIVGGSGIVGLIMWRKTGLRKPLDPEIILPPFLLTVAALEIHMTEEYLTHFGPAMSRLFDISWTEQSFLMIFAFIGPAIYSLTALGLYRRIPLAGFFAWFILIGPGTAEFAHFIFPVLHPALKPETVGAISQSVSNGTFIPNMPNYYVGATGKYYFSGMYTAILPMIPGIYGIFKILSTRNPNPAA